MRVIICGGREWSPKDGDLEWLNALHEQHRFTLVISGGAQGADQCGEIWARLNAIPVKVFKPEWQKWGKIAGFIRNGEMAQAADAAVIFPGGRGTADLKRRAIERGLVIFERQ